MTQASTNWNGTPEEARELTEAISHNCDCKFGLMGVRISTCAAHTMMIADQRAMDGLLAMRHLAAKLWQEEQSGSTVDLDPTC